jgi:hypothetical protein
MSNKQIKIIRRQVKKAQNKIAYQIVEEIYKESFWQRVKIAINIIIKKGG